MIRSLGDWLDHRTGYRKLVSAMLLEHIPGGAKWRYVWGSTLMFVFSLQLVTGLLLMLHYSPGDTTAWGSVFFIQYKMDFGWLIRGLHHFGSQTMVVLLAFHMLQVVIAGAQLPPREFNWWIGLGLLGIVLGLSLTGYLLPWDQKGFYATTVATNIAGQMPGAGEFMQRVIVGGPEYGNHTLTQFFTLHVGILPALLVVGIVAHLYVFRRHGVTHPQNPQSVEYFWPRQAFRDLFACVLVFAVMLGLVIFAGHGNKIDTGVDPANKGWYERWALAGQDGLGANLDAPADRNTGSYPARPEWYFLFLFQLLKYFEGPLFLVGTLYIPNGVMVVLFLLPLLGYGRMRKFGHVVGVVVVVALLGGVGALTFLAMVDDSTEPILGFSSTSPENAAKFQKDLKEAGELARRAVQLAYAGIPEEGARELLRNDPLTRGPKIFQAKCASCHAHPDEPRVEGVPLPPKTASDLGGFGTKDWIRGLLKEPGSDKYFGRAKKKITVDGKDKELQLKGMIDWRDDQEQLPKEQLEALEKDLDVIAEFVANQAKSRDTKLAVEGKKLFKENCASCHRLQGEGARKGPDLTNYGSEKWLRLMIMSPGDPSRHNKVNLMPAFRPKLGPAAEVPLLEFEQAHATTEVMELSDIEREIVIRWLLRDYRVVFGGQTISGPIVKQAEPGPN